VDLPSATRTSDLRCQRTGIMHEHGARMQLRDVPAGSSLTAEPGGWLASAFARWSCLPILTCVRPAGWLRQGGHARATLPGAAPGAVHHWCGLPPAHGTAAAASVHVQALVASQLGHWQHCSPPLPALACGVRRFVGVQGAVTLLLGPDCVQAWCCRSRRLARSRWTCWMMRTACWASTWQTWWWTSRMATQSQRRT